MTNLELEKNYAGVFDNQLPPGRSPVLLIVDFIRAYTTRGEPLYAPAVVTAVQRTAALLKECRNLDVPVIFTRVLYHPDGRDGGLFVKKVPVLRTMTADNPMAAIVPELEPAPADLILNKQYASAFFGTHLAATLTAMGADTVLLTGCSTSGCIRATAVDAMQHGFRLVIPRDCVGDRDPAPHEAALFDINSKYGEVFSPEGVRDWLRELRR